MFMQLVSLRQNICESTMQNVQQSYGEKQTNTFERKNGIK